MIFDFSNELQVEQFKTKAAHYIAKGAKIEFKVCRKSRTLPQNAYLHAALSYLAIQTGYTLEEIKQLHKQLNPDIYQINKNISGTAITLYKSTAKLTKEEFTLAIERTLTQAANIGIYIPEPKNKELVQQMLNEIEQSKQWT